MGINATGTEVSYTAFGPIRHTTIIEQLDTLYHMNRPLTESSLDSEIIREQ